MAYQVTWHVVGADERPLVRETFPERFDHYESAVAFVLDRLSAFPNLGWDKTRGFWARGRLTHEGGCETRFSIDEIVAARVPTRP